MTFNPPFGKGGVIFIAWRWKSLKVVNLSNGAELVNNLSTADTFFKRLKGLMFSKKLPAGHGLLIQPCQSIHTFFMNYSIDVLYISKDLEIVGMDEKLMPAKVGKFQKRAYSVLEMPAGTIRTTETKIGNYLTIKWKGVLQMMKKMKALLTEEQGQGMTEYGLVLGVIAVAVVGVLALLRGQILDMFTAVTDAIAGETE
jgi:uncharacterized protein